MAEPKGMKMRVLHFISNNVDLCIDLNNLNKVIPLASLEKVPLGPTYLAGLMNLASKSIPIIDLSIRLGMQRINNYSIDTPILLCSNNSHQVGLIVDKIMGLKDVEINNFQMKDEFDKPDSPFIASIAVKKKLILLINMDKVLNISLTNDESNQIFNNQFVNMTKI